MTILPRVIILAALAACASFSLKADYPSTIISQGPVGYWRLNENAQPPKPLPAANIGTLGSTVNGLYLFTTTNDAIFFGGPKKGEPGALSGTNATSVKFFNPKQDPGLGGSKVE